jgi:16S rRNA (guanine(966)-N(2))-methyltransferase RsmD
MRVIAGAFKGRRLKPPTWDGLRPTSDKLRETLFNILAPRIEGARVVDGYAGTGALGIEALSRGAVHVTFIEQNRRAIALIGENLAACGAGPGHQSYTIEHGDVAGVLRRSAETLDLVLLDPPYDLHAICEALEAAAARLAPDGVIVLERASRREPDVPAVLRRVRDVRSGDSTLTFLAHA